MTAAPLKRYLLAVLAVVNLLVLFYFGLGAFDLLKLSATVAVGTLIPGLLLLHWWKLYPDTQYRFVLALVIGMSLDILLFIGASWLKLHFLIYLLPGIGLMLYLQNRLYKKDGRSIKNAFQAFSVWHLTVLTAISLLVVGLIVWFFYIPNQLPGSQAVVYHVDDPWHLGNIAEILHHWYPQDPRLAGMEFNYHIFYYVYMAFLAFISKVSLPVIYFRFYIILFLYTLMGGAYFVASRWFHDRRAGILHLVIVFFLGTALLAWPHNVWLRNFFISPTFLFALLIFLPLMMEISQGFKVLSLRQLAVILLLTFAISGAKGNFFPVIGAALLATTVYAVLFRQRVMPVVIILLSSLAVFAVVFLLIFKGTGSEGINILPLTIIKTTALYQIVEKKMATLHPGWFPLVTIPLYLILFYSFRLPVLLRSLWQLLRRPKEIEAKQVFLLALVLAGCIPAYFLNYRGTSQYYFLLAGWAALNLMAAGYLTELFSNRSRHLLKIVMILLVLLSVGDTLSTMQYQAYSLQKHMELRNKPLTPAMYQGLSYLRTGTPSDAVVASFRTFWLNKDNPRFFYYSAFAQRRMVVEGWMYMRPEYQSQAQIRYADMQTLFYTRDQKMARQMIEKYGVDYLLVDKSHRQKLRFDSSLFLEKVYCNDQVELYKYAK
ncbi:MAG TPA: hypothetical protein PLC88_08455 [Syntrophomonas sp.]|nr:hypothetical protein [Syntrophomonas sp.]HRW13538.1 hypothetical protein [Syntrophomonas sp.]